MNATTLTIVIIAYIVVTTFILLIFRGLRDRNIKEADSYIRKETKHRHMHLDKAS